MKSDAASHQTVNPNPKFRQFEGAKVRARIKLIQTFKKKIATQFTRQCLETARYCRARQLRWPPVGSTTQWRRSCFFCHNQRRASPAWGSPSRIQCHHRRRCTRRTLAILRLLQQRKWNHHVRAKPRERTSLLLSLLWLALHHVFLKTLSYFMTLLLLFALFPLFLASLPVLRFPLPLLACSYLSILWLFFRGFYLRIFAPPAAWGPLDFNRGATPSPSPLPPLLSSSLLLSSPPRQAECQKEWQIECLHILDIFKSHKYIYIYIFYRF